MSLTWSSTASKLRIMNERHKEICAWLDAIGFKGPRNYEVKEKSIEILWSVMQKNQEKDREVMAQIKEMETEAKKYEEKGRQLESKLKPILLGSDHLSEKTDALSRSLARIASHLELETPFKTSFLAGMNNLVTRKVESELGIDEMESEIEKLTENVKETSNRTKQHQKVLKDVKEEIYKESEASKDGLNSVSFLKAKGIQYQKKIDSLDKSFASIGLQESLKHERLMEMYERLKSTQEEMAKLDAELDVYQKLPPNISLAKVTIAEAKIRLAKIEVEINEHVKENF